MRGKISDETRAAILKRDQDRRDAVKAGNERRRQESIANLENTMLAQGFEKFTNEGGQTAFRRPQQRSSSPTSITAPKNDLPTSITAPKIEPSKDNTMNILESYQKMFGGGGQQMQPSGGMNFGGKGGGFPSFAQLGQASMGLADAASRRSMTEAALQSSLRRGETGYGSELRQREMGTEYGLRGQLAGVESGLRRGEMGTEYGLRGQLAGVESGLRRGEMGTEYGLRGSLAEREADIAARSSGYTNLSSQQQEMEKQRRAQERANQAFGKIKQLTI